MLKVDHLSSFERCIPCSTVGAFLTRENLRMLIQCSTHLRKAYIPSFVPRVWWRSPMVAARGFPSEFLPFVRRIIVETKLRVVLPHVTALRLFIDGRTVFPATLTYLELPCDWNKAFKPGELPPRLAELRFGDKYDKPLGHALPSTLKALTLGEKFNQSLANGELPPSLTLLRFGEDFNQKLVLPCDLTELHFGERFCQPIAWPSNLTKLTVAEGKLDALPKNLHELTISCFNNIQFDPGVIPSGLPRLKLRCYTTALSLKYGCFPASLTELEMDSDLVLHAGTLPAGLTSLRGLWYEGALGANVLPQGLKLLTFSWCQGVLDPSMFPEGLTSLEFNDFFRGEVLPGVLPIGLTSLKFGANFDKPLREGAIPPNVTSLTFGTGWNRPIKKGVLPAKLLQLRFGDCFNRSIRKGVLPHGLTRLHFGEEFRQQLSRTALPSTLTWLSFESPTAPLDSELTELRRQDENEPDSELEENNGEIHDLCLI